VIAKNITPNRLEIKLNTIAFHVMNGFFSYLIWVMFMCVVSVRSKRDLDLFAALGGKFVSRDGGGCVGAPGFVVVVVVIIMLFLSPISMSSNASDIYIRVLVYVRRRRRRRRREEERKTADL
jgi:di/tricarboxylate transporter